MRLSLSGALFSLLPLFILELPYPTSSTAIGVTYSSGDNKSPPPETVAGIFPYLKIDSVRLPGSDPSTVRAFTYTNTSLHLTIPNIFIPAIASNFSNAVLWLYHHVIPFYPRAHVTAISVGDVILSPSSDFLDLLLPAVKNVHTALNHIGIRNIAVSTTFSFINLITTSFPPSAARFRESIAEVLIKPLLQFLNDTDSFFFVNLYPYYVYKMHSEIPIGYALFQENQFNFRDDTTTGARYRNLFDMMVDAVITAMAAAGHENIPLVVAETGWPSSGNENELEANREYAEMYIRGLVRHLRSGQGTPLRKEGVAEAFIYELFDGDMNQGHHWGIMNPNLTMKYVADFSFSARLAEGRRFWIMSAGISTMAFLLHFGRI